MKIPEDYQSHIKLGNGYLLYFQIVDGKAIISTIGKELKYTDSSYKTATVLEIPNRIDYEGEQYDVVKISDYAFVECDWFEKIVIAEGITEIAECAFGRGGMKEIVLPNSIRSIGFDAFKDCEKLESLTLPEPLEVIPYAMCAGCSSLKKVVMSDSVKRIHAQAFEDCIMLNAIRLSEQLEEIGDGCFEECEALREITLPKTMKIIYPTVFKKCIGLKKMVNHSPNFECSGDELIDKERALLLWVSQKRIEDYTIPQGVEYFPWVFVKQECLKRIVIPEGVKIILNGTFYGCDNLRQVELPKSLIAIDDNAFNGCKNLQTITLPMGVMSVADSAFIDCENLTKIIITGEYTDYLYNLKFPPSLEEIEFTNPNERHQPLVVIDHKPIKITMANGNEEEYKYSIL